MAITRRRVPQSTNNHIEQASRYLERKRPSSSSHGTLAHLLFIGLIILLLLLTTYRRFIVIKEELMLPVIPPSTAPDAETILSRHKLLYEDARPTNFSEQLLVCMPTVSRGGTEYVSNAVKSWRIATKGSIVMRRLLVFDMNHPALTDNALPEWYLHLFHEDRDGDNKQTRVMSSFMHSIPALSIPRLLLRYVREPFSSQAELSVSAAPAPPSWLIFLRREGPPPTARGQTLGDSAARVAWRSKEAADYADVLRRCADAAQGRYVAIVQDDVLFTTDMASVVNWADTVFASPPKDIAQDQRQQEGARARRRRPRGVCSLSLFDLAKPGLGDAHVQQSSNMVARVWQTERAMRVAKYIAYNFDEAPVDWLADRLCKSGRRVTLVKEPNPVRHRGAVSSFSENQRSSTLT